MAAKENFPTTSSVSKGCFVIRPSNASSASRKRKASDQSFSRFPVVNGENEQHRTLREQLYIDTWTNIEHEVSTLQSNLNNHVFENILTFISRNVSTKKEGRIKNEIPTGVFITGVNMPDHETIFSDLVKKTHRVTPHVARLCSKNCPNLKSVVKEVSSQIIQTDDTLVKGNYNMALLSQWYEMEEEKRDDGESTPVVFIFEDFESFQAKVLQDFITICSLYVDYIPIILIFGVATIPAIVHQLLPRAVSSFLCIEKFHCQPAITLLLEVIDKIFINSNYFFKLGPKVFQFLYENFLFHDFSLQNFVSGLKFCIMDHFYSNPLSILCTRPDEKIVAKISHAQLEMIRKCASFQRYVEAQTKEEKRLLVIDDNHTKAVVSKLLVSLQTYHQRFFPVIRCLALLVTKLPGYPLGKKCRDIYESCLKVNIKENDSYEQAIKMASFLAKDELVPILEGCIKILGSSGERRKVCSDFKGVIKDINDSLFHFEDATNAVIETEKTSTPINANTTLTNRFELQEKLKSAVYQKRKDSPFERNRGFVISKLDEMFQKYLTCPREQTLYEIFYYNDIELVKQRLSGCPRVAIQTALNNPRYYLSCPCCDIEPGAIQDTLPDISIAFKLHLECGRLINLYDWLQAYLTVTEPVTQSNNNKSQDKTKEQELQARFIQAVSELQFLGFIKGTKRKTDHVARLTWGNC